MESFERVVPDTNVLIECFLSAKVEKDWKINTIIVHHAVLAELEHQANAGKSIGFIGLDELKKLRKLAERGVFAVEYKGRRPSAQEIKHASQGEIDALIRELAYEEDATLLTADKVQFSAAEARGVKVEYVKPKDLGVKKLKLEAYFDTTTMSVHLKEAVFPYAKKGVPGSWQFVQLATKELTQEDVQDIAREIIEETKRRRDSYIELERMGSTIVQLGNFRIVITRPPLSDGWEVTAVRPVKKLTLDEYHLSEKLVQRLEKQAEGVLIAGAPGMGKSTAASALALFYAEKGKIVKTIEAPRDLVLPDSVTQYAISHGDAQEIHDILLLTRPDYTIFDEMRNTKDFLLFADLRLAGIGLAGVIHATNPIDAIQRFVGRIELGVIPHVIDTVIFIKNGQVAKVLNLEMTVKVPSGMTEADLARPVVTVHDFETNKLEYEIYSYGEETVVVPVTETALQSDPTKLLAAKQIEQEMLNYVDKARVKVVGNNKAEVYVPSQDVARVIGKQGKSIEQIEKKLGFHIDVRELEEFQQEGKVEKGLISVKVQEDKHAVILWADERYAGEPVEVYVDGHFLFTSTLSKKGDIKLHKKSKLGQTLADDLRQGRKVEIRV